MDSGEEIWYISEDNPSSNVVSTFAKAIRDRELPSVGARDSYEAMRVVFAIEQSRSF